MNKCFVAMLACVLAGCSAQHPVSMTVMPDQTARRPWTHLRFNNDPEQFQFAIVGDRTGRHRAGVFEKGIDRLNLLRPEFVMSVGDLIEGYTKDENEIDEQWREIDGFTAKLESPFFYVPGNHDMSNSVQADKWRQRFGPAYYRFVYRNVLFMCINTSDPIQQISSEQIAYFERALKENPRVRWTCVFLHEPLWDYKSKTGWDEIEKLLADRSYTVFAGHYHTYTKYVRHDRRYIVLATTGGGMKKGLTGPELGSFDHVTWVTMLPDGPRVANIAIDGIYDEDVRTEAMAKLIDRVLNGNVLQIGPLLARGETFERGEVKLNFTNDADVPMKAQGTVPAAGLLRAVPEKFELTVGPKSLGSVSLEIRAEKPVQVRDLPPLAVQWTATYERAGRPPVRVPREDLLAVEQALPCRARTAPVVIDGNLDEWQNLPQAFKASDANNPAEWTGPKDSSYQFAVEHDEKFVYIAVKTTDDTAILNPKKEPWSQDGIEVRFDARPDPERSQSRGRGEFKEILVVSMSPGEVRDQMVLYSADQIPAGVQAICVKTPTGHNTEIGIPVSYLESKQPGPWKAFRLNIAVNDFDKVAGPLKALWWRPDWRSAETFAASGTFERK